MTTTTLARGLGRFTLTQLNAATSADRKRFVSATREQLADWRAAIDDLRVQVDLGCTRSWDEAQEAIAAADRAWSVAQQRLAVARGDVGTSWSAQRDGINDAMRQLAEAVRLTIQDLTKSTTT